MIKPNEINGGRGVRISENTFLDLEGRCSIQLSYGRSQKNISGWPVLAQAWLSGRPAPPRPGHWVVVSDFKENLRWGGASFELAT
jgi:hypothetical protein